MRTVLISGCGSGFGAQLALAFAQNGDRVIATLRNPADQAALLALDKHLDIRALDVTDPASITTCVEGVIKGHGSVDVLINNAGIHLLGAVEDMPDDDFRRSFETNFFGAMNLTRAVLPHMRRAGRGHVITISSVGSRMGRVADGAYCASKAAVEIMMEALRYEVMRFGIQVAVVCPGAYKTGISRNFQSLNLPTGTAYGDLLDFRAAKVRASCAGGGDPAEVVAAIKAIADNPAPPFRHVIGEQAQALNQSMSTLDGGDRQSFIVKMAGIDWWISGTGKP